MKNGLFLLVDDREPESATPRITDYGITAITKRLVSGDYMFVAHGLTILIERKCVSPDTRVLRSDLHWVKAGTLCPGDDLYSIEENHSGGKGGSRKWFLSRVVANSIEEMESCLVRLDDGTELICSEEHPWLAYAQLLIRKNGPVGYGHSAGGLHWVPTNQLKPGMKLPRYLWPWDTDNSYGAGYLAGALDGEACIAFCKSRPVWSVIFSQLRNAMLEKVRPLLNARAPVRESTRISSSGKEMVELHTKGGASTLFNLIGSVRAERLIDVTRQKWTGGPVGMRSSAQPTVVEVIPLGRRPMAALEVEGHTYMAEGFAAHNTISNLLGSMATKQLVSQAHALVENSDRAFILREGAFARSPSGHLMYYSPRDPRADSDNWVTSDWTYDSFSGIMLDLQLMGIDFIDCPVLGDYPRELARIVMALSKKEHGWIRDRQRPEVLSLDKQYKASVWSLCALEGMGPKWAEAFITQLGTLAKTYEVLSFNPEVAAKIKCNGRAFGPRRAERVNEEMLKVWT